MRIAPLLFAVALAVPVFGQSTTQPATAPATAPAAKPADAVPGKVKPLVQIAILIDTSGSMNGLINQAKTELWRIVNEIAKVKVDGEAPEVQVALYRYGSPDLGAENNFVRQLVPLSDDLDKVSAELFKLTTSGGSEYCGAAIKKAVEELRWSDEQSTFRAIFIAGNEPFTQGPVDFKEASKLALSKGININTIYCGPEATGISTGWKDGAALADGTFSFIEQNQAVARAAAPQDKQLAELGSKLNETYIPYGKEGLAGSRNQAAQDANAASAGRAIGNAAAVAAERAITKSNQSYKNATWDLVDAVNEKRVALKDLKAEELPEEMRKLDDKGREEFIAQKTRERTELQAQIKQLGEERDKYLASIAPPPNARGGAGGAAAGRGAGGGGGGFGGAVIGGAGRGR